MTSGHIGHFSDAKPMLPMLPRIRNKTMVSSVSFCRANSAQVIEMMRFWSSPRVAKLLKQLEDHVDTD